MTVIESIGKNVNEAIEKGLNSLGKTLEDVKVEIIKHGGLFSKAKVRITVEESDEFENAVPEKAVKAEKPVAKTEKPIEKFSRPEKSEKPERTERPEKTERAEKPERAERSEKPERAERPERPERTERAERPEPSEHKQGQRRQPRRERSERPREKVLEKPEVPERHYEPVTPELAERGDKFAEELLSRMNLGEVKRTTSVVDGELHIDLETDNSAVIGYHGEVLDSIEYLVSFIINKDSDKYYHAVVNCNNYREKRKESLVAHANKMAAKCLRIRHKVVLEPMNSNERKIIHSALADNEEIITRSEGHEPNRRVVILCKRR